MTLFVGTQPVSYSRSTRFDLAWWVWLLAALSLAFIQSVPTVPAIAFLGTICLYSAIYPRRLLRAVSWNLIPWTIVLLGALSVIWSEQPGHSARAAAQIAISTVAAILFAQDLRPRSYIAILMFAFLAAITANFYVPGIFGAKNSLGLTLALLLLASCWVMLDRQQAGLLRIFALIVLCATPPMLIAARSEGALLAGGLALTCSLLPFLLRRLPSNWRLTLFSLGVLIVIAALGIAFWSVDNLVDLALISVGKDVSLTGRTLLWSHAATIIAEHPLGGVGLQAFWVEGNRDAEQLWAMFYIDTRMGFHFHSLWLETGAELGIPGILIAASITLIVTLNVVRWALRDATPESCFFVGFLIFVLARTFGEVELFIQFNLIPMVFLAGYFYAKASRDGHLADPS